MNPTPTLVSALDTTPEAMPIWWIFPVILAVVALVNLAQRWYIQQRHRAHRLAHKQAQAAHEAKLREIDEAMFAHLPADESGYRRARMALHLACVRYERPDLIVSSNPKHEVTA
jgi:hypothetical protein